MLLLFPTTARAVGFHEEAEELYRDAAVFFAVGRRCWSAGTAAAADKDSFAAAPVGL